MGKLTHKQALETIRQGGRLPVLARAVGVLADDPDTTPEELLPALDHPGIVAEQAAIALHRMTGTPWAGDRKPITSRDFWDARLRADRQAVASRAIPKKAAT